MCSMVKQDIEKQDHSGNGIERIKGNGEATETAEVHVEKLPVA